MEKGVKDTELSELNVNKMRSVINVTRVRARVRIRVRVRVRILVTQPLITHLQR